MLKIYEDKTNGYYQLKNGRNVEYDGIPSRDLADKLRRGLSGGEEVPFSQDIADLAREYDVNLRG